MNLSDIKAGQVVRVLGFDAGREAYRHQLLSMGFTPGSEILVKRCLPWGGCLEVCLRGFSLALRRAEAAFVQVELVSQPCS